MQQIIFYSLELIHGIDTDKVNPYIEDSIAKMEPLSSVLRLICIQSICNDGLKPKVLEYYKREIIQVIYIHQFCISMKWQKMCSEFRALFFLTIHVTR